LHAEYNATEEALPDMNPPETEEDKKYNEKTARLKVYLRKKQIHAAIFNVQESPKKLTR
jgi:hypothetical protein